MPSAESPQTPPSPAEYLAAELERLMALPLETSADLEHWYDECAIVEQTLERQFPDFTFEHEIGHFFIDADIRFRDRGYRDRQHGLMWASIRRLRASTENS